MAERTDPSEPDAHLLAEIIQGDSRALSDFAQSYLDIDPDDTSPEERARLREVCELLETALNRFSR